MKRNFFVDCHTIEALKKEYRRLAWLHHPDNGGDAEIMKSAALGYG
jgi:curved DNA-binding protein CbpA